MPWACCGMSPLWNIVRGLHLPGVGCPGSSQSGFFPSRTTGSLVVGKGKTASGQATPWEALGPPELETLLGPGSRHPGQSQAGFPLVAPTGVGP